MALPHLSTLLYFCLLVTSSLLPPTSLCVPSPVYTARDRGGLPESRNWAAQGRHRRAATGEGSEEAQPWPESSSSCLPGWKNEPPQAGGTVGHWGRCRGPGGHSSIRAVTNSHSCSRNGARGGGAREEMPEQR